MKAKNIFLFVLLVSFGLVPSGGNGQGTFQNLDFESAVIVPVPGLPGVVEFAPALPGWTGYLGTNRQTLALFNNLFVGSAGIALLGPGWSGGGIIAGNYTAVLQAGSEDGSPADAAIAQSGLVPPGTRSIQLVSSGERNGFVVSLGGQQLSLVILGAQNGYNIYAGDITQFAGETEDLRITALSAPLRPGNLYLDSITFSSLPIPEPRAINLLLCGAAVLGWSRWRRAK